MVRQLNAKSSKLKTSLSINIYQHIQINLPQQVDAKVGSATSAVPSVAVADSDTSAEEAVAEAASAASADQHRPFAAPLIISNLNQDLPTPSEESIDDAEMEAK